MGGNGTHMPGPRQGAERGRFANGGFVCSSRCQRLPRGPLTWPQLASFIPRLSFPPSSLHIVGRGCRLLGWANSPPLYNRLPLTLAPQTSSHALWEPIWAGLCIPLHFTSSTFSWLTFLLPHCLLLASQTYHAHRLCLHLLFPLPGILLSRLLLQMSLGEISYLPALFAPFPITANPQCHSDHCI